MGRGAAKVATDEAGELSVLEQFGPHIVPRTKEPGVPHSIKIGKLFAAKHHDTSYVHHPSRKGEFTPEFDAMQFNFQKPNQQNPSTRSESDHLCEV